MVSAIVITKNEEKMIEDCLKSLSFCDEIILVDTGNTDLTNSIGQKYGCRIVESHGKDYAQFRNDGLKAAKHSWIFYLDADERVSRDLAVEIGDISSRSPDLHLGAFAVPRQNIYLGRHMTHGGWGDDYVIRFFPKSRLVSWHNPLHEQPEYKGDLLKLKNPIIHHSHRDLSSMLAKTIEFTSYEARLRFEAHHPPMTWWRFFRVMFTEFWFRFVKLSAWADGTEGVIDGMFQVFNTFIIYARLWEMQLKNKSL